MSGSSRPISYVSVPDGTTFPLAEYLTQRPDYTNVTIQIGSSDIERCADIADMLAEAVHLKMVEFYIDFGHASSKRCIMMLTNLFDEVSLDHLAITSYSSTRAGSTLRSTAKTVTLDRASELQIRPDSPSSQRGSYLALPSSSSSRRVPSGIRPSSPSSRQVPSGIRPSSPSSRQVPSGIPPSSPSSRRVAPALEVGGCFATISHKDLNLIFNVEYRTKQSRQRGGLELADVVMIEGKRVRHKMTRLSVEAIKQLLKDHPRMYARIINPEVRAVTSLDMPAPGGNLRSCLYELKTPDGTVYRSDVMIFME